jgi:hypothetical protein
MSSIGEYCSHCGRATLRSLFDTTWKLPDGRSLDFFGVEADFCGPCQELFVADTFREQNGLTEARCTFAIELLTAAKK